MNTRRYFNTEGLCDPDIHYMVRMDDRVRKIKQLFIDRGKYFVISKGRQYGKTTTLKALAKYLEKDYAVLFLDFQKMSTASFESENRFAVSFAKYFISALKEKNRIEDSVLQELTTLMANTQFDMNELFAQLSKICEISKKPVIMIIDEVDSAANNQVFLDFLAQLRGYYLDRKNNATFHSVILAGVYDIKNLKLEIRPNEEHKYNSPWNVAARFNIDMSFSTEQIALMLQEYENDAQTGMDVQAISKYIYAYTSGYPYLVSAICKFLDEEIPETRGFESASDVWTEKGVTEAVSSSSKKVRHYSTA